MRSGDPKRTLMWGVGLILLGFAGLLLFNGAGSRMTSFTGWGGGGLYDKGSYASSGERIYYLGMDSDGKRLRTRDGPHWLNSMGGSCVNCHGADGRGGFPVMMGTKVPPDIRYKALASGARETRGEAAEIEQPYTDEDIRRAITEGVEPDGKRLDPTMPKWKMSDQDLQDLLEFLKTLD
ncbi:MAG: cytochrome c [bacterium]|nr:cytochrome c [bacterium]MDT8365507.1 cytochrome c [bacterium]